MMTYPMLKSGIVILLVLLTPNYSGPAGSSGIDVWSRWQKLSAVRLELPIDRHCEELMQPPWLRSDLATTIYDVLAKTETVRKIVDEAKKALNDGRVQDARRLLDKMASEVVVRTTNIPMATYPSAIKQVAPLIDSGKIDEAKQQLQIALNLLVVTDVVMPLPTTRADVMLKEAETLAEKKDRSKEENDRLTELFKETRQQVDFGREQGYFNKDRVKEIGGELNQIEKKTGDGKSGKGFFDKMRGFFKSLDWRE